MLPRSRTTRHLMIRPRPADTIGACPAVGRWRRVGADASATCSTESIEPALRALGIWAPIGFIVIYASATVLFFSGALLSLAGGALFGPVWGTVWNLAGATLGATAAFLLARTLLATGWRGVSEDGCGAWSMASPPRDGALSPSCAWCRSFPSTCSTMRSA